MGRERNRESDSGDMRENGMRRLWGITCMRHERRENYGLMKEWCERDKEQIIILNWDFRALESGRRKEGVRIR